MKRLDPFSKKIDVLHCYLQNEVFFLSVDLQSVDRVSGQVLASNPFYVLKRNQIETFKIDIDCEM
jgi:hypothetical protein